MGTLWHASDKANIDVFRPHRAPSATLDENLVWAVDEEHLPAYWFPRDCPRATFWIGAHTLAADAALLNGARRVHAIEWDWWERFRSARIFLYELPVETFVVHDADAGYFVSREAVVPRSCVELGDLIRSHMEARIELRLMENLWLLWDRVIASTLHFSGIRLRNARPRTS